MIYDSLTKNILKEMSLVMVLLLMWEKQIIQKFCIEMNT